jgi:hypothetical protein
LALTVACHDSTGPAPGSDVNVAVALMKLTGPSFATGPAPDNLPALSCDADLQAANTGSGGATWREATFFLYAGKDRSTPVDSVVFPAADMQNAWGSPQIGGGQTQQSRWHVTVTVPWAATFAYHYASSSGGAVKTASVSFNCGPIPPATAPPPTITSLSVQAPALGLQPGDTLGVSYAATGQAGLWATTIRLSGPCDVRRIVAETLQVSITNTLRIPLPSSCRVGMPIGVTLEERDAALQWTTRTLATQLSITDRTPPKLVWGGVGTPRLAGDYFVGDTINVQVVAWDDNVLEALTWEVWPAGFRDSLRTTAASLAPWIGIPVQPAWGGPIRLRFYARDAAGLTSDTLSTAPDSIRVYPTIQRPVTTTTLPAQLLDMQIDAKRGVLYVVPAWGNNLFAVATTSLAVTSIPLPYRPWGIDLSPGGDSLILTLPEARALAVLDLRQPTSAPVLVPVTQLDTAIGQRPSQVVVAANGKAFLHLEGAVTSAYMLREVDLTSGAQRIRTDAGNKGWVGGGALARSFDHSTLVMNGPDSYFQRYDAATDAFGPALTTPNLWGPTIDGTGQHIVVGLDLYDAGLQFVRRLASPIPPAVPTRALSPDGVYLYEGLRGIVRTRVSDGLMQDRSPAPFVPDLIRLSPDGTLLAMFDRIKGTVAVMDLR